MRGPGVWLFKDRGVRSFESAMLHCDGAKSDCAVEVSGL